MGLFDFLFGSPAETYTDPEQLRRALFEATTGGKKRQMRKLCEANREMIVQHFSTWQTVPEEVRGDRPALERYFVGLMEVANTFASHLGSQELLQKMMGPPSGNPLAKWQQKLAEAQQMMAGLRYGEARDLLTDLLIDVRGLEGSGVDTYLPITLGLLGECLFQSGEAEKAIPHMKEALRLCEAVGDGAGVVAYLGNLYEIHRYLGQGNEAADHADRLATALEQQGRKVEADRYRKQAAIVRAGEPLNRVVVQVEGVSREVEDVEKPQGRIQLVFERSRLTLRPCQELTRRGEELGGKGENEAALAAFREAASADPHDPHARYLEGFTLLQMGRYAEATEAYEATERLAPGWFHCRSDLWLAQQMVTGRYPEEVVAGLHVLEDGPQGDKEKLQLADGMVARVPDLARAHLLRAQTLSRLGRDAEALDALRTGLGCAEEPEVRTMLLAELGTRMDDPAERERLLREAVELNGNLVSGASARLALKVMGRGN